MYYLLFFGAVGSLIPFFNIYLQQKGLSGAQIGWLGSIPPLVTLIANPFWGGVADRWQIYRQVLFLCALSAGGVSLLFLQANSFWLFMVLVIILFFFRNPMAAIVDGTVMSVVTRLNASYGRQRLWGTTGFLLASLVLAQFLTPQTMNLTFWLHATLLGLGCAVLSIFIPVEPSPQNTRLRQGLKILLGQPHYLSFFIALILMGIGLSCYVGFLGLHVLAVGGTERHVGLVWAANSLLEIPMMYFGASWFARFSFRRLIPGAMLGYVVIWGLIGLANSVWLIIAVVLGIGLCYGVYWVAVVGFVAKTAPVGLRATSQAMVGIAMNGFGWSIGSVVAGYVWDQLGGGAVFGFASLCALAAIAIFLKGCRQ
ncbi:MAG: putative 3-phenylpropionic acid transporter [Anaerolineae bacterium]|nr:putative 3-phenylpropionic acid transporter [Anaerolineae bacterium]